MTIEEKCGTRLMFNVIPDKREDEVSPRAAQPMYGFESLKKVKCKSQPHSKFFKSKALKSLIFQQILWDGLANEWMKHFW